MAKYSRIVIAIGFVFAFYSLTATGVGQDLCLRVDMKPVLSLDQVRMADMAEFLCEIAGLKNLPTWPAPAEIEQMTPEEYYKMEVKMLAENGFPPIFMEMEPDRLVNRRFFNQLMFQIAMETDEKVKANCKGATTETEQVECLAQNDWISNRASKIYRNEILSILCEKRNNIQEIVTEPELGAPQIITTEITGGVLGLQEEIIEKPATPF